MDSTVLTELLTALPEWTSRLQQFAAKFPENGNGPSVAVNPGVPEVVKPPIRKIERPTPPLPLPPPQQSPIPEDGVPAVPSSQSPPPKEEHGTKKMNAKPSSTKAKFSSITGPDIYYDGASQQCLFDCWTYLNSQRGYLRKEMMAMRRRKVMALPSSGYGYSDSDDELEPDDEVETEEDRLEKLEEERQRLAEEAKRSENEKKCLVLEFIDGCLDKAARACESSAFLWLKGEGCAGHIVYINARMMEAVQRISAEIGQQQQQPVGGNPIEDEDEGFGEELDAGHTSEEELPHKRAGDRNRGLAPSSSDRNRGLPPSSSDPQPVGVAG